MNGLKHQQNCRLIPFRSGLNGEMQLLQQTIPGNNPEKNDSDY
jgi:hypothetical protein